jgi:hypothetical protein
MISMKTAKARLQRAMMLMGVRCLIMVQMMMMVLRLMIVGLQRGRMIIYRLGRKREGLLMGKKIG